MAKAEKTSTTHLNLDEVEAVQVSVTHKGIKYFLKETSVSDFVKNVRALQAMESAPTTVEDVEKQLEGVVEFLAENFEGFPKDELRKLGTTKLKKLALFAQTARDNAEKEIAATQEAQAKVNPPTAG